MHKHEMAFGERLRRTRKAQSLTQGAVAAMIGRHQSTINRWEKGVGGVQIEEAEALGRALNDLAGAIKAFEQGNSSDGTGGTTSRRAPDESEVFQILSAYAGSDPRILSLRTTAELLQTNEAQPVGEEDVSPVASIERPSRIVGRVLAHFEHLPINMLEVAVDQATEAAENVYDATFRHIVELQISKEPGEGQPKIRPADRALPMPSRATSPLDEVLAEAIRSRSR